MKTIDVAQAEIIFPEQLRAREVISRSNAGHVFKFPSIRYHRMIHLNSTHERDQVCIMDVDTSVVHYQEQPFKIRYVDEELKVRTKFPDLLVFTVDGRITVVEVTEEKKANEPEIRKIFEYEEMIVRHYEYEFTVMTDKEIEAGNKLINAKELRKHRNIWVSDEVKRLVLTIIRQEDECTGSYLLERIPEMTHAQLLSLRAHLILSSDLEVPLSLETRYSINKVRSFDAERQYRTLLRRVRR